VSSKKAAKITHFRKAGATPAGRVTMLRCFSQARLSISKTHFSSVERVMRGKKAGRKRQIPTETGGLKEI
jgi:hypothetical protein